jgi:hypothetical protein
LGGLQEGANARHGGRTRVTPVPQIEDKSGIANRIPAESGGSNITLAKIFLDLSQQMH